MIYQWKSGSRYSIGAQIAAERLKEIGERAGGITPRNVVDDARSDNSPLHKCFEWNDAKAADEYRLEQARGLIGSLVVVKVNDAPVLRETRAFLHVSVDTPQYVPTEVALSTPDMRAEILQRAKEEIIRWKDRYSAYAEFGKVVEVIDTLFSEEQSEKRPARVRRGVAA
jgi:hypothetical protein